MTSGHGYARVNRETGPHIQLYPALQSCIVQGFEGEDGEPELFQLEPGAKLELTHSYPTEEGACSYVLVYRFFPEGKVTRESYSSETDCDGKLDRATISQINSRHLSREGLPLPTSAWEVITDSQRDHFAEQMGY